MGRRTCDQIQIINLDTPFHLSMLFVLPYYFGFCTFADARRKGSAVMFLLLLIRYFFNVGLRLALRYAVDATISPGVSMQCLKAPSSFLERSQVLIIYKFPKRQLPFFETSAMT